MTYIFFCLEITVYSIALLFHIIGITATSLYKKRTSQNLLLFLLSAVETGLIVIGIILRTNYEIKFLPKLLHHIIKGLEEMFIFQLVFTMYILTCDRLLCVIDPLKYHTKITKTTWKICFVITLDISILLAVLENILNHPFTVICIFFVIGILYILMAITTYGIVVYKLKKSNQEFTPSGNCCRSKMKKQFLVPGVIILTFLVFYVIPYSVQRVILRNRPGVRAGVCQVMQMFGLIIDPIIYIFLTKHYRTLIYTWCLSCLKCQPCRGRERERTKTLGVDGNINLIGFQ